MGYNKLLINKWNFSLFGFSNEALLSECTANIKAKNDVSFLILEMTISLCVTLTKWKTKKIE